MTVLSRVEERGCGCDALEHQRGLVAIDEAIARIMRSVRPVPETEEVALAAAHGRILAEPVCALSAAPPFDNAAMDGYAVNTASLTGTGPWRLAVTDRIAAGQTGLGELRSGTAAQIFTGAPIPEGADAVVMQEDVQRSDGAIIISRMVEPRLHVRAVGEDMEAGATVVPTGRQLTARDIAACAAAGVASIRVRRRVRVALLVTGDEIEMPGRTRECAGIWDVNTPMLSAAIRMSAIDLVHVETGKDDRETLRQQLGDLAGRVDLIVTTGGISVGEEDHVRPALSDLGVRVIFSGVAIKPGKPVSFGHHGGAHWLGLPGNPLSAFITWQLFGPVLCQALAGGRMMVSPRRHVVLSRQLGHKHGRCELRLADLSGFDDLGREIVVFDDVTHSGRVARLATADGVILIPAEAKTMRKGALVEFQPFSDR
jgi:molybdopterin molybdotransferase